MFAIEIILVLLVLLYIIYVYYQHIFTYWECKKVVVPSKKVLIGNISKKNIGIQIKDDYTNMKRRGINSYFGYYIFGKPFFIPMDLELIKNITTRDFYYFSSTDHYVNENQPMTIGLFSLDGEKWSTLRRKLEPLYTSDRIKMMFETIDKTGDPMVKHIRGLVQSNQPINIGKVLKYFVLDVIGNCAFGLDCNTFENPGSEFKKYTDRVFNWTTLDLIRNAFTMVLPNLSRKLGLVNMPREVEKYFTKLVKDAVDYRIKNNVTRNDILQSFIELMNIHLAKGEEGFGFNEILAESFLFLIGGSETCTFPMTFAMFEMCRNENIQDNVRKEVQDVMKKYNGQYTFEALSNMTYLNQVVEEVVRKYPTMPVIMRRCTHNYKIPDVDLVIEKNTNVFIPVYAMQHDPDYYPDPEKFDPDRFSDENKAVRIPYTFLAFGVGPRKSLGSGFGMMQMKLGLAYLLNNFKFSLDEKTPMNNGIHETVLLKPKHDIWLNATPLN